MKLVCKGCGAETDYGDREIRLVAVEQGDEQLFQVRRENGESENVIFHCRRCGSVRAEERGEGATEWSREQLVLTKVFDDPSPRAQIQSRISMAPTLMLDSTTLNDEESQRVVDLLLLICRKLASVWKHLQRYGEIEDRLIEELQRQAAQGDHHVRLAHAQDLFIEFDEFLMQLKSSLDYLVKFPSRVLPPRLWSLHTFGEKGDQVIKALENNIPGPLKRKAKFAAHWVRKHRDWLEGTIDTRDRINHLIGAPVHPFFVRAVEDPDSRVIKIERPMWVAEQTVRDYMDVVWENNLRLFEDFIVSCLFFRFKEGLTLFHGPVERGSPQTPWHVKTKEQYEAAIARGLIRAEPDEL
jgi:hypothetical protein